MEIKIIITILSIQYSYTRCTVIASNLSPLCIISQNLFISDTFSYDKKRGAN